jgi:heterodisulfide reductase subunit B
MKLSYYPGCTLYTKAKNLDMSARATARELGIDLVELPVWNCCGAVFSLASDNIMNLSAPIRNLARAKENGESLVTICSGCYHTLKRANRMISSDEEKRKKLNDFMEGDYSGDVAVLHLLEVFRDMVGFDTIREKTSRDLSQLSAAPYYGCLLLRPQDEMEFDSPENPEILENFLDSIGTEVVSYPFKTECCGAYLAIAHEEVATDCSYRILKSAQDNLADLVVTSCPLCHYNLDYYQIRLAKDNRGLKAIPVVYFTQLLGLALGLDESELGFDLHHIDPRPVLQEKLA